MKLGSKAWKVSMGVSGAGLTLRAAQGSCQSPFPSPPQTAPRMEKGSFGNLLGWSPQPLSGAGPSAWQ